MINTDELHINLDFWKNEDESRIHVLKLLLAGYSNNFIASELNFSLKNIESIISKLFKKTGIPTKGEDAKLINPRAKLFVEGISKGWLQYRLESRACPLDFLTRNQYLSLLLCAAGCSNKGIAEFLCISTKTIESRLNSLFHQFTVNIRLDKQINPRIKLLVNALCKRVITYDAIVLAAQALEPSKWEEVMSRREQIKDEFLRYQLESGRPQLLQPNTSVGSVLSYAIQQQQQQRQSIQQPVQQEQNDNLYGWEAMPQPYDNVIFQ